MAKFQAEDLQIYQKKVYIRAHLRHMEGCLPQMRKHLRQLEAHIRQARRTEYQLIDAPLVFIAPFYKPARNSPSK